ncbi:hypothetical protein WJX84_011469 [Apatococcus fuscideae]|uniref:Uncharacterized protein n=1 Tax=Apatococcus fuscideae TaxID=2026836 RepID=A0AAW1STY7_9CHLO
MLSDLFASYALSRTSLEELATRVRRAKYRPKDEELRIFSRYYAGTLANCLVYSGGFLVFARIFRGRNYKSLPRSAKLKSMGWRGIGAITVWQETHRRGADRSISDWMQSRTPMAGELMAILQESDPNNRWTTALPVDVLAHMPRVMAAGAEEAAQGSSLESLEVGWAAARGGGATLPQPPDNMAGLNSDPMFSTPSSSGSEASSLDSSSQSWQDEAREVLGGTSSPSTSGSGRDRGKSWRESRQEAFRRAMHEGTGADKMQAPVDELEGGPEASTSSSEQQRHDRDTGGTHFDSRWDNPQQ